MERGERLFWSVMGVLLLFLAALVMWQIMQTDYSLRQAEHRCRLYDAQQSVLRNRG